MIPFSEFKRLKQFRAAYISLCEFVAIVIFQVIEIITVQPLTGMSLFEVTPDCKDIKILFDRSHICCSWGSSQYSCCRFVALVTMGDWRQ